MSDRFSQPDLFDTIQALVCRPYTGQAVAHALRQQAQCHEQDHKQRQEVMISDLIARRVLHSYDIARPEDDGRTHEHSH